MPILKYVPTGNGSAAAARVELATLKRNNGMGGLSGSRRTCCSSSPVSDTRRRQSRYKLALATVHTLPPDAYEAADPFGSLERALIENSEEFAGGTYVPEEQVSELEDAKALKWSEIKAKRVKAEDAGYEVAGVGTLQSDPESRQKIVGASLAAKIAKDGGAPYSVDWTLANNAVVSLDADKMIEVGQLLLVHLDAVHQESRRLYQQIQDAQTVEDVEAIQWGVV